MRISLVSYYINTPSKIKKQLNADLFNNSKADLIVFPGYTFNDQGELTDFINSIENKQTIGLFDFKSNGNNYEGYQSLIVRKGIIKKMSTQMFTTANDVNRNVELVESFLHEFKTKRKLKIKGIYVRLLQCGEVNILRNEQLRNNEVHFRLRDNKSLIRYFNEIVANTNIFINIQHTPMGNQGKLHKRREYLSKGGKWYFSTTNSIKPEPSKYKLQYCYFDGKEQEPIGQKSEKYHSIQDYIL